MDNNNNKKPVRIPEGAYDTGDDLSGPVVQLLTDIHVLASEADFKKAGTAQAALTGPPESVAIIEAGATAASKVGSIAIGALGGLPAIVAVIEGIWGHESDPVRIAFVGGGALVLAAISIAIGIIISADVGGRAAGSAAEYHARALVASTFLRLSRRQAAGQLASASVPLIAGELHGLKARVKGGTDYTSVTQVGWYPGERRPVIKVGNQWVDPDNVEISRAE